MVSVVKLQPKLGTIVKMQPAKCCLSRKDAAKQIVLVIKMLPKMQAKNGLFLRYSQWSPL